MNQYKWATCPQAVRDQIEALIDFLRESLGDNLVGVYLHGSLALECFNPDRSDADVLVITEKGMTVETKRRIAELLLQCSAGPAPIEISFLARQHIAPWHYPTPYDFHYGEDWREKIEKELASGEWKKWNEELRTDKDLAAHITVTRKQGIALDGPPIDEIFPSVPEEHYIDSLIEDFRWGRERMTRYPTNFILNTCRVLSYLSESRVLSKDEAGAKILQSMPQEFKPLIAQALEIYRGNQKDEHFDAAMLKDFADHMAEQLRILLTGKNRHTQARALTG